MTITMHKDVYQGTAEWYALRCGILTASEIDEIVTPSNLQVANNDKSRKHLYNLMAQRITQHVEQGYVSFDMMRGDTDEIEARQLYNDNYAPVEQVGFVTNDRWGFTIGCSPDGLVGEDGGIECKSRLPKFQLETIIADTVPSEFMIQIQTCMLVTERKWWDFNSYCGGLPMFTKRVMADEEIQAKLVAAAAVFYDRLDELTISFAEKLKAGTQRLIPTERRDYGDIAA